MTHITYPRTRLGAPMRLVNAEVPSAGYALRSMTLEQGDEWPLHVGLVRDCGGVHDLSGHTDIIHACPFAFVHGHIIVECDDGTGMVPAPIVSRDMIRKIFDEMERRSTGFTATQLNAMRWIILKDAENLPDAFTDDENTFNLESGREYPFVTHSPKKEFTRILREMEKGKSPYIVPFFEH